MKPLFWFYLLFKSIWVYAKFQQRMCFLQSTNWAINRLIISPPNSCWNRNHIVMALDDVAFEQWLGHEGGALRNELSVLTKGVLKHPPSLLLPCEDTIRRGQSAAQKVTITRTWACWQADLRLPVSRTVRNTFVFNKPTNLWLFVTTAWARTGWYFTFIYCSGMTEELTRLHTETPGKLQSGQLILISFYTMLQSCLLFQF